MKKFIAALILLSFAVGCGSGNPFDRGARVLGGDTGGKGNGNEKPSDVFNTKLLPLLESKCSSCHDNKAPNFETAAELVVPGSPETSVLYLRATGTEHKAVWKIGSTEAAALSAWIVSLATAADQPDEESPAVQPLATKLDKAFFDSNLQPSLENKCSSCHENPAASFEDAAELVVPGASDKSELYLKATGTEHKAVWKKDSAEAAVLVNWINGAKL